MMTSLDILTKKVHEAARQLKNLKEEKVHLIAEIELLQTEIQKARQVLRENEALRRRQERLKDKLKHLLDKLSRVPV